MALGNDTRGWIMTALSGIACMLGASIICVDLIICRIPGRRDFKIQDSNAFLSSSLSLSFGVMLFSALYNMLPSAKTSLQKGGYSAEASSWILIALFIAGAVGIQVLSRILHHYIPSHMVDCDHTHDEESPKEPDHSHEDHASPKADPTEPLSPRRTGHSWPQDYGTSHPSNGLWENPSHVNGDTLQVPQRRPSFTTKVSQLVSTKKDFCDGDGQCYGYTDPCGVGCFKYLQSQSGRRQFHARHLHPPLTRSSTTPNAGSSQEWQTLLSDVAEEARVNDSNSIQPNGHHHKSLTSPHRPSSSSSHHSLHYPSHTHSHPPPPQHHHHVPTNAFLSIGLQTSIAIALHKLPEGFITYATNHANPKLGFTVFLALFIHNITEGFAMALPLYLAINSRGKAMIWSALLGGVSQPCGAAVAAVWFRLAGNEGGGPSEAVYGGMFAVVAGIMASVALQLFSESLDMTHNKNLCMAFAFVGMGILGISSALTA